MEEAKIIKTRMGITQELMVMKVVLLIIILKLMVNIRREGDTEIRIMAIVKEGLQTYHKIIVQMVDLVEMLMVMVKIFKMVLGGKQKALKVNKLIIAGVRVIGLQIDKRMNLNNGVEINQEIMAGIPVGFNKI